MSILWLMEKYWQLIWWWPGQVRDFYLFWLNEIAEDNKENNEDSS